MTAKPRIAIVHPRLGWGGSEARALWGIQALIDRAEVTLITAGRPDWAAVNRYYGTDLDPGAFRLLQAPMPRRILRARAASDLRGRYVQRFCRRVSGQFDLMVSAYNPVAFREPGLQFIADFSFDPELRREDQAADGPRRAAPLSWAYRAACTVVSRRRTGEWKRHGFVANSQWSRRVLAEKYGLSSSVLFPPVLPTPSTSRSRAQDFLWIGRVSPEKRLETIFDILGRVRASGFPVRLTVAGGADDATYEASITARAAALGDWIRFVGRVERQAKQDLLATHAFGISARPKEPFGISVAEMVTAGVVPFVPSDGGQAEIVDHPALQYASDGDAATKIAAVLADPGLQRRLRAHLAAHGRRFGTQAFISGFQALVAQALASPQPRSLP